MRKEQYEPMPLNYKVLRICMHISRGKYEGCYIVDGDNDSDFNNSVLTCMTGNPESDFLYISKYAVEFAENQIWDDNIFVFVNKFPKYILIDDDIYGKLLVENTAEDLVAI